MTGLHRLNEFFQTGIWRITSRKLPRREYLRIRYLRVILLSVREFQSNKCQLNAAALSFYLLLSVVPLVAMAFGIAKGFGFGPTFQNQLLMKFPGQEQTLTQIFDFANNLLGNAHSGVIAGTGIVVLFWTVIQVLNNIEVSFNEIWGVKASRSFGRKISDYLSIILVGPFFLIVSSAATVFLNTQLTLILKELSFLGILGSALLFSLNLLPFVVIWIFFTFLFMFMPNTKVNFLSAFMGGLISGTVYQMIQVIYIQSQLWVGGMNVVYGSFAALPLFLIWMQLSWQAILFGVEISFAHQNVETYEFEKDCLNVSYSFKHLLSLYTATVLVKRFINGQPPVSATQVSHLFDVPIRLVQDILFHLTKAGIISEIRDPSLREPFYQLGQDSNHLTIQFVSDRLLQTGSSDIPIRQAEELESLQKAFQTFSLLVKNSPENKLLRDI